MGKLNIIFSSICSSISLLCYYFINKNVENLDKISKNIINTKLINPGDLINLNKQQLKDLQFEQTAVEGIWKKQCMIQGLANSKFAVNSFLDGITKLICSFYFEKNIYSNKKLESVYQCLETLRPQEHLINTAAEFELQDINNQQNVCKIKDFQNANFQFGLQLIKQVSNLLINQLQKVFVERKGTKFESFFDLFKIFIEYLINYSQSWIKFKGVKIGIRQIEFGIQLKTLIQIYGTLFYDLKKNQFEMINPEYLIRNKSIFLQSLISKITLRKLLKYISLGAFLLSTWFLFSQLSTIAKNWIELKKDQMRNQFRFIKNIYTEDISHVCPICYTNPRTIILVPCKHLCLCRECYQKLPNQKCPICNKDYNGFVEIFMA